MNLPEYIADGAWETVRRLLATVFRLMIDTGGQSIGIRFGTQTLSWAGGTTRTNSPVIAHGLGKTPVAVFTGSGSPSSTWFPVLVTDTYTDTEFTMRGITSDNSNPAAATTVTAYWLAVG